jgi:hypothetical protein
MVSVLEGIDQYEFWKQILFKNGEISFRSSGKKCKLELIVLMGGI